MSDVKPFDFGSLPKVSRENALLLDQLGIFLPRIGFSEELGRAVKRIVHRLLGVPFSFEIEVIKNESLAVLKNSLTRQGVYLIFGLAPLQEKAWLEVDPFMAQVAIDRLLGGGGEPMTMGRPLTEIEEGVLSYIFLKILAEIFERCGRSARVHFRLEGCATSADDLAGGDGIFMTYRLTLGERSGYARLILPSPFVHKALLDPVEGTLRPAKGRELEYYSARLANLGFLEADLWAEIGRATLKPKDLQGLERGDVIVLEKTALNFRDGKLEGQVPLRVGRGGCGSFAGQVVSGEGPLRLKVEGVHLEHPV